MPGRDRGRRFASVELTGTGSAQTAAHGFHSVPKRAWIEVTQYNPTSSDATSTALVTSTDDTNVIYTVHATSAIIRYIVHAEV